MFLPLFINSTYIIPKIALCVNKWGSQQKNKAFALFSIVVNVCYSTKSGVESEEVKLSVAPSSCAFSSAKTLSLISPSLSENSSV